MNKRVHCRNCEYAQQDYKASEYTGRRCKSCDKWENCPICNGCEKKETCKARQRRTNTQSCDRRLTTACPKQSVKWIAYQCTNAYSEYYGALLNVSVAGEKQAYITWTGCENGEERGLAK